MEASNLHARRVVLVRNLQAGNMSHKYRLIFDDYSETVHSGEDQEPPFWSESTPFQSFNSAYDDDECVPNLDDD